ncbi:hypothetical protein [Lachnoclostridium sp. Marseille-P6806]|uniref:hypothetical protein n=1 Tax=Lachnoclostridium sp. Marseille-P6806 TaxID=2364793 RepID=UPI001F5E5BB6|nr:hypothetical protein [Lachnoclostridium sp. Marseille-P6806]
MGKSGFITALYIVLVPVLCLLLEKPSAKDLLTGLFPVISVLAGWVLFGQRLSPREIGGCFLMFAAIVLAAASGQGAESGRSEKRRLIV